MTYSSLTPEELESAAYAAGDSRMAAVLAQLDDALKESERLEEVITEQEADSLAKWEKNNGPAYDYYQFFHECFARLDGHYPCPSITSDYDKSVIFDAIGKGK